MHTHSQARGRYRSRCETLLITVLRSPSVDMSLVVDIPALVGRQAVTTAAVTSLAAAQTTAAGCDSGNDYDGRIGLRISAIFVILIGSCFGRLGNCIMSAMKLTRRSRSCLSNLCCPTSKGGRTDLGLFHSQILWFGGDHCYSLHTCEWLAISYHVLPRHPILLTLSSSSPQPTMPSQMNASQAP